MSRLRNATSSWVFGLLAASLFLICSSVLADPFEEYVPLELARALLGGQVEQTVLYPGFPPDFPEVSLPDSVTVLGSVQMMNVQRVVLDTGGPAGPVRDRLVAALETEGYLLITQPPQRMAQIPMRGFQTVPAIPDGMPLQLCHEQHGMLLIRPLAGGSGAPSRMIELHYQSSRPMAPAAATPFLSGSPAIARQSIPPGTQTLSCEDLRDRQLHQGMASGQYLSEVMPQLLLPAGAILPQSSQGGIPRLGISGGGLSPGLLSDAEMQMSIELSALYIHFARQLREQGWQADAEAEGEHSATGTWVSSHEIDGTERAVYGVLSITELDGDDTWRLRFVLW